MTASVGTLGDPDGFDPSTVTYRWQRPDAQAPGGYADIEGATSASYTLTQADVGQALRVVASYSDGTNASESAESAPTNTVANVNDAPTGAPAVTGTATQGQELTASPGNLADEDGLGTVTYRWQRSNAQALSGYTDIEGATGASYTPTQADVGQTVRAVASYTDGQGTPQSVNSDASATVANVNDPDTGTPAVAGTARQGETLTASVGTLDDPDGFNPATLTYRWQRSDAQTLGGYADIAGATQASYTLTQADVGQTVRAVATHTDAFNSTETTESAATTAVTNVDDAPTGRPAVSGTAEQGQVLTATAGDLADPDGFDPAAVTYRWQRSDAQALSGYTDIEGATSASYTPTQADVGQTVRAVASYTDRGGTIETAESAATAAVANVNDPDTGTPAVTGTARQGETLMASAGTLDDPDGLGGISYRWQRADAGGIYTDIAGATQAGYTLAQADVGRTVRAVASYTDAFGTAETAESAATAAVANVNDPDTGAPAVTGTAEQGQVLSAGIGTLADPDGFDPAAVIYRWQRSNGQSAYADIAGATGNTHMLTQADVGGTVRAVASYTDNAGTAEIAESTATAPVADVNDAPTGAPAVAGTARRGETLTATTGTLADADGIDSTKVTYRWQRSDAQALSGYTDIEGATSASYTPTQADVGQTLRAVASYTDNAGTDESVESAATAAVTSDTDGTTGDTTPPDAPVVLGLGSRPGSAGLFVRGTAEAGSAVEVYRDAEPFGTVTAGPNGAWAVPLAGELDAGTYAFTATATDAAGNVSPTSSASTVTVEGRTPAGAEPTPVTFEAGARGVEVTRTEAGDLVVTRDGVTQVLRGADELRFIDGRLVFDPADPAAQVARLYRAGLGRGVDQGGLEYWTEAVEAGAPLGALAGGFLASPEGQALYGADSSDAEFVARLYRNVLGREGDEGGVAFWTNRLGEGAARADVLAAVADSGENRQVTASQGVWDLDEGAAQVARLYDAVLGRLPDAGGLAFWAEAVNAGRATPEGMAEGFMASPEFQAVQSAASNADFVRALYQNTLDRPGDEGGVDYWTSRLDAGLSRAALVVSFSESPEHTALTAPDILGGAPGAFGVRLA